MSQIEVLKNNQWVNEQPSAGDRCREILDSGAVIEFEYAETDIDTLKSTRITQIKQEAQSRITALDWRLERAKERAELSITDQETVQDVMQLREQIRTASNQAEIAVNQLTDAGAIQQFQW
ncbi:hypothetical protein [Vibrio quintilis]|uniref:Uncharacterized protein n=1 Tax=Vibrio quintilis TaxID=1117707 RepID=A0A1M7YYR1_9VIBR|nr:hypothetical protein [Vibrio quintilis]SHO57760.1 hypothetical protein VQ7734_03530 [Vibrio quintilis]